MKFLLSILFLLFGFILNQNNFENYTEFLPDMDLKFDMVAVPGGSFQMGASDDMGHDGDEGPIHEVELDAFWMSKLEVSWALFEPFLNKNFEESISSAPLPQAVDAITRPTTPYLDMTFGMGKEDKPVVGITQYGARQFCKWLYSKTGHFYRLPTEAEWEYAATCGKGTQYKLDGEPADYAWYEENSGGSTQKLGTKKANEWGIHDLFGNVMEWTEDAYVEHYPSEKLKNPVVKSEDLYPRVLRGGHFDSEVGELRPSNRFLSDPQWKQIDPQIPKSNWWFPEAPMVGIRLVRPKNPPLPEDILTYYDSPPIEDY